jgi:hypothetical protein
MDQCTTYWIKGASQTVNRPCIRLACVRAVSNSATLAAHNLRRRLTPAESITSENNECKHTLLVKSTRLINLAQRRWLSPSVNMRYCWAASRTASSILRKHEGQSHECRVEECFDEGHVVNARHLLEIGNRLNIRIGTLLIDSTTHKCICGVVGVVNEPNHFATLDPVVANVHIQYVGLFRDTMLYIVMSPSDKSQNH